MSKCIVQTFNDKTYLCPNGDNLRHSRPTVVEKTTFIETLRDDNKIQILAVGLPNKAEDSEFYKVWHEAKKDVALAVESFCAEFGIDPKGVSIPVETTATPTLTKAEQKALEKAQKAAEKEAAEKEAAEKEAAEKEAAEKEAAQNKSEGE